LRNDFPVISELSFSARFSERRFRGRISDVRNARHLLRLRCRDETAAKRHFTVMP
jgi:hypothetical protein